MMKTIVLTNKYDGEALKILKAAIADRFELVMLDEVSQDDLQEKVKLADYLLVSGRLKINEPVLQQAGKLKMIQRTGVGLDNIALDSLRSRNIPLYVNAGVNANSVAEHAVMLMLETLKRSFAVNLQIRKGIWKKQQTGLTTHEISGKTIGIIGMGRIGQRVAEILSGFHVNILYYDQYRLSAENEEKLNVHYAELEDVFKSSDIITLHCAMNSQNQKMISDASIETMKNGVILINTARGGLIDTDAVIHGLESGKLAAVGLDTFEEEPLPKNSRLLEFENAILSPHIGGVSFEAFERMMYGAIENICSYDENKLYQIEKCKIV